MAHQLSAHYRDLLAGSYDCVDRIVLNAYFSLGMTPGGFRYWWQQLTGSEEKLDNEHLMRLAGRFSRRVRAYTKANQIPVKDCAPGERKHKIGEQHLMGEERLATSEVKLTSAAASVISTQRIKWSTAAPEFKVIKS